MVARRMAGAHINADWAILEVVDSDYRPVTAGQLGSEGVPIYESGEFRAAVHSLRSRDDRIMRSLRNLAARGSRLPRIERIEGRSGDLFWTQGDASGYRMLSGVLFPFGRPIRYPTFASGKPVQTEPQSDRSCICN